MCKIQFYILGIGLVGMGQVKPVLGVVKWMQSATVPATRALDSIFFIMLSPFRFLISSGFLCDT
jgi:hypothetical protein